MGDVYDDMIDSLALAKANDPRAAAAVEALLDANTSIDVKTVVVRRLSRLCGQAAEDALVAIAEKDSFPEIRLKAAKALRGLESEHALSYLLAGLSADDPTVREDAIRALSQDHSPDVHEAIRRLLADSSPSVRVVAAETMASVGYLPAIADLEAAYKNTKGVRRLLLRGYLRSLQRRRPAE